MVLRGYFDDSGDNKRESFSAVGGLVGQPDRWSQFEMCWSAATYDLSEPFHSTDCEAQRGCCEGWTIDNCNALMKTLTAIIKETRLGAFGAVVPVAEYRSVFPDSKEYDPYFLALKQTIINMAYLCRLYNYWRSFRFRHDLP
jgi:hypothetical protein